MPTVDLKEAPSLVQKNLLGASLTHLVKAETAKVVANPK